MSAPSKRLEEMLAATARSKPPGASRVRGVILDGRLPVSAALVKRICAIADAAGTTPTHVLRALVADALSRLDAPEDKP